MNQRKVSIVVEKGEDWIAYKRLAYKDNDGSEFVNYNGLRWYLNELIPMDKDEYFLDLKGDIIARLLEKGK
jgi:hypothetical protein